jgi:hypothetical protein
MTQPLRLVLRTKHFTRWVWVTNCTFQPPLLKGSEVANCFIAFSSSNILQIVLMYN